MPLVDATYGGNGGGSLTAFRQVAFLRDTAACNAPALRTASLHTWPRAAVAFCLWRPYTKHLLPCTGAHLPRCTDAEGPDGGW